MKYNLKNLDNKISVNHQDQNRYWKQRHLWSDRGKSSQADAAGFSTTDTVDRHRASATTRLVALKIKIETLYYFIDSTRTTSS